MRVNMGREGRTSSSLSANGGTMLGSLILANGPSQPLEAATKYYVDTAFANLNANNVVDGVLPISSLPGFTGDATSNQGNNTITLANLGINPGSYAKVIVDSKGRVTGNDVLSNSDLPVVSWSKIQNEPTTIEGYGITDALTTAGGAFTGNLSVGTPTQSLSAVNKQYVDSALSGNSAVVGDIIRKPLPSTPTGFLRCNGGLVDKITYSDLYAVIGDNFVSNPITGVGRPWQQQYQINSIQSSDINGWTTGTALPATIGYATPVVTKNRVYLLGGYINSVHSSGAYTAPINPDGSLGTWVATTSLPVAMSSASGVVIKDKLYICGGWSGSAVVNAVYYAIINSDGTLGSWNTAPSMPSGLYNTSFFITKNKLYICGGTNGASTSIGSVYIANFDSSGFITNWETGTSIPDPVCLTSCAVIKNKVYLFGGWNMATTAPIASVYVANINSDGTIGAWTATTNLPVALSHSFAFVTKNRVYLLGGYSGGAYTSKVYTAEINSDGSLGTWTTGSNMVTASSHGAVVVTKNKIYYLGGFNGSAWLSTVQVSTINSVIQDYSPYYSSGNQDYLMPGSGKPWQQQYQINNTQTGDLGAWSTETALPITLGIGQAVVTKNYVYLLGGQSGAVALNTIYKAPINTDGTLGTWSLDSNTLPGALSYSQVAVTKNRVYLIAGHNGTAWTGVVYTAPINSDGTLGLWGTSTSLPGVLVNGQCLVTRSNIYILGGGDGSTSVSTVYVAAINSDGTIGGWSVGTSLPGAINHSHLIVTKNRVYLLGGINGPGWANMTNVVYTAPINADGTIGTWSTGTALPVNLAAGNVFVTKNTAYILGGGNGTNPVNTVYASNIDSDGVLGTWVATTTLPAILSFSHSVVTKNRIYLLGGSNNSPVSSVYSAPILEGTNDYSQYYDGTITPVEILNYVMPGSGKPWQQQYQINTTQSTDITGWTTTTSLPGPIGGASTLVTKNRVYVLGGWTGSAVLNTVYSAPINPNGTLGTWVADNPLATAIVHSQVITTKNRVYLISGDDGLVYLSTVQTAAINADGTLGTWSNTTSLPLVVGYAQAVVTKNRVYLLGGKNNSIYLNTIYTAVINSDGTLGTWVSAGTLPTAWGFSSAVITKNRIYLCGGCDGTSYLSTVYTAPISSDGLIGTWATGSSLPGVAVSAASFVTKNRVYLFGGTPNMSTAINTVYTAPINSDGVIGNWTAGTSLPSVLGLSSLVATNSNIYLLGGWNGTGYVSTVHTATITDSLNDYSQYYDGTILPVSSGVNESNLFALPDFSNKEKNGVNIYIKY